MIFKEYIIICKKKSATVRVYLQNFDNNKKSIVPSNLLSYLSESDIKILKNLEKSINFKFFFQGGGIITRILLVSKAIKKAHDLYLNYKNTERFSPISIKIYDIRKKERKKFGLKKARKSPQFSKR
jgi:ribosomal protein S9